MPARAALCAPRPPARYCEPLEPVAPRDERATACAGAARARTPARHACRSLHRETRLASDARLTIGVAPSESRRGLTRTESAASPPARCKCSGAAWRESSTARPAAFRLLGMCFGPYSPEGAAATTLHEPSPIIPLRFINIMFDTKKKVLLLFINITKNIYIYIFKYTTTVCSKHTHTTEKQF